MCGAVRLERSRDVEGHVPRSRRDVSASSSSSSSSLPRHSHTRTTTDTRTDYETTTFPPTHPHVLLALNFLLRVESIDGVPRAQFSTLINQVFNHPTLASVQQQSENLQAVRLDRRSLLISNPLLCLPTQIASIQDNKCLVDESTNFKCKTL